MTETDRFNDLSTEYDSVADTQCQKLMPILFQGDKFK